MIEYIPILFFLLIGLLFGLGLPVIGYISSKLTGSNNPDDEKLSPYECGFDAFEDARMQFDVKYFGGYIIYYFRSRDCFLISLGRFSSSDW